MQSTEVNSGYRGETIDIKRVLHDISATALSGGWSSDWLAVRPQCQLLILHRAAQQPRQRLYISAGIHGDEPAGPMAVLRFLQTTIMPADVALWICPCLNPTGVASNRRENESGVDLNRDYLHLQSEEIRAHVAWLRTLSRFEATYCLHEDWEAKGFYLYELYSGTGPSRAAAIIEHVRSICPIEPSGRIDGRKARHGIIRTRHNPTRRQDWPEAFYLAQHHTKRAYTLETPSSFPLETRIQALVAALQHALMPNDLTSDD